MNAPVPMSPQFANGLVVGKFCPLHRGHLHLIDHARRHCSALHVLSYTVPEFPDCGPGRRERWLQAHYSNDPAVSLLVLDQPRLDALCATQEIDTRPVPHNDMDGDLHRDFVAWLCFDLLGREVDAVFTSEDYGDGFAAAMTRYGKARHAGAGTVQHVCVDRARGAFPVSGTALRDDLHRYWEYLAPTAAGDLVESVLLLGGESSGKSTLAQALARSLQTNWVPEYGREHWLARKGRLDYDDLLHIARMQVMQEDAARARARRWLICDTSPLTTLLYSQHLFGRAAAELEALADRRYDHVLVCAPDFPFEQDGTRQDAAFRTTQHEAYLRELQLRGIHFKLLTGSLRERVGQAVACLGARSADAAQHSREG